MPEYFDVLLGSAVRSTTGFSTPAKRTPINPVKRIDTTSIQLESISVQALVNHRKVALKVCEGAYIKSPWVKARI